MNHCGKLLVLGVTLIVIRSLFQGDTSVYAHSVAVIGWGCEALAIYYYFQSKIMASGQEGG